MTSPDPALVERIVAKAIRNADLPEHLSPETREYMMTERPTETDMKRARAALAALRESGRLVEWRPIDDDTPLSEDLLLAVKEPVGWTIECGWAGGKNTCAPSSGYSNGWRHGRASHWSSRPAPPATAETEENDG